MTPEELQAIREHHQQDNDAAMAHTRRPHGYWVAHVERGFLLAEIDRLTAQVQDLLKGWAEECDKLKADVRALETIRVAAQAWKDSTFDPKGDEEATSLALFIALAGEKKP